LSRKDKRQNKREGNFISKKTALGFPRSYKKFFQLLTFFDDKMLSIFTMLAIPLLSLIILFVRKVFEVEI